MRLRIGRTSDYALEKLNELKDGLQDPDNISDFPVQAPHAATLPMSSRVNAYLGWAQTAENRFRELFADTDMAEGLFGDRYWHIAGLPVRSPYGPRIISQEIAHQRARLDEAIETLTGWKKIGDRPGKILALDTNSILQFRPYDEIPWTRLLKTEAVRLVLTMPVLDELDAKKYGTNERLKKRARKVLPRIDKAFGDQAGNVVQLQRNGNVVEGVTLEILPNPPGHRRMSSDMDEEFLDRCEFLQQAAGRPVTVVTADTNMKSRVRGRAVGLQIFTLPDEFKLDRDDDCSCSNAAESG